MVPLLYLKEQMLTSDEKHHSHSLLPASIPRPNGEEEESLEHGVGRAQLAAMGTEDRECSRSLYVPREH